MKRTFTKIRNLFVNCDLSYTVKPFSEINYSYPGLLQDGLSHPITTTGHVSFLWRYKREHLCIGKTTVIWSPSQWPWLEPQCIPQSISLLLSSVLYTSPEIRNYLLISLKSGLFHILLMRGIQPVLISKWGLYGFCMENRGAVAFVLPWQSDWP